MTSDDFDTEIECPCCGDVGAEADEDGLFYDGQELICGCKGHVTFAGDPDEYGDSDVYIMADDCECSERAA